MNILDKAIGYFQIGGLNLLLFKAEDKITHRQNGKEYMQKILKAAEPEEYPKLLKSIYQIQTSRSLNLDDPKTFNEMIQWMKLYDTTPLKTRLADKLTVRDWIKDKVGEQYLIPLLGVWDRFDEIEFDKLPDSFVLKCNHGSQMNVIVKDKAQLDIKQTKKKFDEWQRTNYAFVNGLELQYKDIRPVIIAEKYIEQMDSNLLDYKIHVFGGEPKIVQIIGDRIFETHDGKEAFVDLNWNHYDLKFHTYDTYKALPQKPDNLNEMIYIARTLGAEFRYVRVDLYNVDGNILFGEMTFTPKSGFGKWGDSSVFNQFMEKGWKRYDKAAQISASKL